MGEDAVAALGLRCHLRVSHKARPSPFAPIRNETCDDKQAHFQFKCH